MVQICWYLAAVVQVQLCKYFIEIGDSEQESTVWGEINVLRFAMLAYGQRSPIGSKLLISSISRVIDAPTARQERLLQGLMREIVRLTAQKQPLEVGVPLYPFSHNTLWRKDENSKSPPDEPMVPLPMSPAFKGQSPTVPSHGRQVAPSGWPPAHESEGMHPVATFVI